MGAALLQALPLPQPVRLVGLGVSGFDQSPAAQLALPGLTAPTPGGVDPALEARRERLDAALDRLRHKFGTQAVQRGRLFHPRALTDEEER